MSDLICRKTMRACLTPGMCSPFGGCRETEPARAALKQGEAVPFGYASEIAKIIRHARAGNPAGVESYALLLCDKMDSAEAGSSRYLRRVIAGDDGERVHLAAPPPPAAQTQSKAVPEFDHSIGDGRYTVVRGSFWWHVRIGDSTANVGKFYTELAAQDMALKLLTAFRDGAFVQHEALTAALEAK